MHDYPTNRRTQAKSAKILIIFYKDNPASFLLEMLTKYMK